MKTGASCGLRFFAFRCSRITVARSQFVGADSVRDVPASRWDFSAASAYARASCFAPSGESLLPNAEEVTKKACPGHPVFRLGRKIPSLNWSFRGTPRRAIPGPSRLSRHPCRSTPETPIQRGLLNGAGRSALMFLWKSSKKPKPKPKPERARIAPSPFRERAGGEGRPVRRISPVAKTLPRYTGNAGAR